MATISPRPLKFLRPSGGDGVLAELNDKLNKRRQLSENGESPKSEGNSPMQSPFAGRKSPKKPHPPIKNRSGSLSDLQKHQVNSKLKKSASEGTRLLTQSLSLAATNAVVGDSPSRAVPTDQVSSHSKSLPKMGIHSVVGPPPSRPPPKFKGSSKQPAQLLKEEMASEKLFSPVTPVEKKKKKGGAHKLLKKLRKKQTRKVSEIPPNQILFSRVPMETISPPSGDKGYQNIFDFEQRDHPSVRKCESISKTPKKPMPIPRANSMSNSSFHRVSFPDTPQQTSQSDRSVPIKDLSLIATPDGILEECSSTEIKSRKISVKRLDSRLVARRPTRRHRSTRREAKQLRKGVCSDSETKAYSSSDDDDYITMNPALAPMLLAIPSSTQNVDPRASGYYLKILPPESRDRRAQSDEPVLYASSSMSDSDSTSDPEEEPIPPPYLTIVTEAPPTSIDQTTPTSPDYIHMESWMTDSAEHDEGSERDVPSNWIAEPVTMGNPESQLTQSLKMLGKSPKEEENPVINRSSNSLSANASLSTGRRRILKYSDVTIHPVEGLPRKLSKPQKFKYQTVNLKEGTVEENPPPLPVHLRSPASHPHTITPTQPPTEERVYYKTTSSLFGSRIPQSHTITAPPLSSSLPPRRREWHSYVEIDTDEFESAASQENEPMGLHSSEGELSSSSQTSLDSSPYRVAPPTVPERPDDLDGWVQSRIHSREQVVSGDYSYVKRGAMPLWLSSRQHRRLVEVSSCRPDQPPVCTSGQQVSPPSVPPKTASLLREVGLKPFHEGSPEPYLYPVFMKRRAHTPGDPNVRVTLSKVARLKKRSNKGDQPPPVSPYLPKKGKSPTYGNTKSLGDTSARDEERTNMPSEGSLVSNKSPPPSPPKKIIPVPTSPPPVLRAIHTAAEASGPVMHRGVKSSSELSPVSNKSPPPVSRKIPILPPTSPPSSSDHRGSNSSLNRNPSDSKDADRDVSPAAVSPQDSVRDVIVCSECDLESHVDRHSLAVIYQHKREIVRRLSQRRESETGSDTRTEPGQKDSSALEQSQSVRSLDKVVSELDMILRQNLCSRTDLIRAIENQLRINISGDTKEGDVKETTAKEPRYPYQNMEYFPEPQVQVQEGKPRSGTVICHDSDSDEEQSQSPAHTSPPPTHTSPPHRNYTHTQSSPTISSPRQLGASHPRTLSTPLLKIEDSCHDNNQSSYPSDTIDGSRDNLSVTRGDNRCYSNGWTQSPLKRTNAKRRTSASTCEELGMIKSFSDGHGVFTHHGGQLTKMGSGVEVEVPEGAVPRGQKQRLWFDVIQTTFDPQETSDAKSRSLSELSSSFDADQIVDRKDRQIQLSPMILIGPSDAVLNRPIKIKLPHCLPYRNNSWHLQVFARPHDSSEDSWTEVANTMGLVDLPNRKHKKEFKHSTSQLHMDYVTITTTELGYFKLMGRPIRNGVLSAKQMLGSVFLRERECESDPVSLEVFVTDALTDHVQSLQHSLLTHGRQCLQRNMPVLCFGDGKDMEVLISSQSRPLGTMVIPFGQFWRQKVIGQACASFNIEPKLLSKSRTLTLKIQQAGAKYIHETNFLVP